jgi:arginine exporter protein ArgO
MLVNPLKILDKLWDRIDKTRMSTRQKDRLYFMIALAYISLAFFLPLAIICINFIIDKFLK